MQQLAVMDVVLGLLLAVLALPLIANKIKPNPIYGFRVKQTLENPEVWYKTNHYAGKQLLAAGIGISVSALILSYFPGISLETYALSVAAVTLVVLGIALVRSWRYMKSIL